MLRLKNLFDLAYNISVNPRLIHVNPRSRLRIYDY